MHLIQLVPCKDPNHTKQHSRIPADHDLDLGGGLQHAVDGVVRPHQTNVRLGAEGTHDASVVSVPGHLELGYAEECDDRSNGRDPAQR